MVTIVEKLNEHLGEALGAPALQQAKLRKYAIVAKTKLAQLQQTMSKLLPQIHYWIRTGYVASGKIISLHIPQLYSIVRGKVGKPVEFGLSWGITRLAGGYLLATLAQNRHELQDTKLAVRAVKDHIALFVRARRRRRSRYAHGSSCSPRRGLLTTRSLLSWESVGRLCCCGGSGSGSWGYPGS
jgi:hypothetical protein